MIWIFRKLRNLYARWQLRCLSFNYNEKEDINRVFEQFLAWDWDDISYDNYHMRIFIQDRRTCLEFWNSNKYYGYASEGKVQQSGNVLLEWQDKRPSAWNIYKMKQKIEEFEIRKADITLTQTIVNRLTRTSIFNSSSRPTPPPPPPPSANIPGSKIFIIHKVDKMHDEIQRIK